MELDYRIQYTISILRSLYTCGHPKEWIQQHEIHYNRQLKALLTQKAGKKIVKKLSDNNRSNTQHTCSCDANNPRPGICIRDILKKKIARCG